MSYCFQIIMPSGSYVSVYYEEGDIIPYLDIYVYPLRADAYHTTGLCGNYNLNITDDVPDGSQSSCSEDCEDHRHDINISCVCMCLCVHVLEVCMCVFGCMFYVIISCMLPSGE